MGGILTDKWSDRLIECYQDIWVETDNGLIFKLTDQEILEVRDERKDG